MSATNGGPAPQPETPPMPMPQIGILAQYVKDFSFENPNAPRSMAPSSQQPAININVGVDAAPLSQTDVEVTIRLEGKAEAQETPIGRLPTRASLDTSGLGLTDAQLTTLLSVDREVWHEEAATIPSGYERFGDRLPKALWDQYHALVARLAS